MGYSFDLNWKSGVSTLAGTALLASGALAICEGDENTAVPASTPTEDFVIHNDDTVTHKTTGLMWKVCSLGQRFDQIEDLEQCPTRPLRYSWEEALAEAADSDFAGYTDWRVPNLKELNSIVEHRCATPSLNSEVFKGAVIPGQMGAADLYLFWTSTPDNFRSIRVRGINFNNGNWTTSNVDRDGSTNMVRLVRDAD